MIKAPSFSRETLVETLTELAGLVGVQETTVDLALYGPACLLLATTLCTGRGGGGPGEPRRRAAPEATRAPPEAAQRMARAQG